MKSKNDLRTNSPELMRCITLNICHLSENAREWLQKVLEDGTEGIVAYEKCDFWQDMGFFVYLFPEDCYTGVKDLMPESFRDCFDYAVANQCGMIIFDSDGPCMANLKAYSSKGEFLN